MVKAFVMYLGLESQCAEGLASRDEAYQWLIVKAGELAELGILSTDYEFVIKDPSAIEMWLDLTRI